MPEQASATNGTAVLPHSVPWPTVVYTLGTEENGAYQPTGTVPADRSRLHIERKLGKIVDPRVHIIETTVMPWTPPRCGALAGDFEYTVGFGHGGQYTTWGLGISRDRDAIEAELTTVQAAVTAHNIARAASRPEPSGSPRERQMQLLGQYSLTPLLLTRPLLPWSRA